MSLFDDLVQEFSDSMQIIKKKKIEKELDSILDAGNLDIKAKFRFIAREIYDDEDKLERVNYLIENINNKMLEGAFTGRFSDEVKQEHNDQETHYLDKNEMNILQEVSKREYDPTKLLTAGDSAKLPVALKDKLELHDLDETEVVVISRLYDITFSQARKMITNRLSNVEDIDEDEVTLVVEEMLWDRATITHGFFVLEDEDDEDSKISYMEYFKREGFNDANCKIETLSAMRKKILSDLDAESRMNEYAFEDFNWDSKEHNNDEMEFDGVSIVPKRKVKYDYAIKFKNQPLQIEHHDKLAPSRQFAPYDLERCTRTLTMLDEEIAKNGINSRLNMEKYFYQFKKVEAEFLEMYREHNGVKITFNEWTNELMSPEDCDKNIRSYYGDKTRKVDLSGPDGFKSIDTNSEADKAFKDALSSVFISYYDFKKIEHLYNEEMKNINTK